MSGVAPARAGMGVTGSAGRDGDGGDGEERARFVRFAVVGVLNTIVHYLVFLPLWFVLPYLAAHLVAISSATLFSYYFNCRFTFGVRPTARRLLLYPLSNLANIALSTAAVYLFVESFSVDSRVATLLGGIAAMPVTFVVSRTILVGGWGAEPRG